MFLGKGSIPPIMNYSVISQWRSGCACSSSCVPCTKLWPDVLLLRMSKCFSTCLQAFLIPIFTASKTYIFRWDRYRLSLGHAAPAKVFDVLSDTFKDLAALSYLSHASWETIQATDLTGYSFMGKFFIHGCLSFHFRVYFWPLYPWVIVIGF